jgi:pyridoxine 4-dehydrogenase
MVARLPFPERARKVVPIVSVQNRYNLTDRDSQDVLDYCEKEKMGFLPWAPIGRRSLVRPWEVTTHLAIFH